MDTRPLLRQLRAQRKHVVTTLDGLDDARLTTPVAPTSWAPIALVQHLALDVERWWFAALMADEPGAWQYFEEHPGGAWTLPPDADPRAAFTLYEQQCAASDAVIERFQVDDLAKRWPDFMGPRKTLGEIVLHTIAETAAHAGQLDIVRESIDGRQWLVLD